ncbi:MAG: hypothetical protein MR383_01945 [Lachnospiraceae bacterium]|nr:hypothetical protein [Lachnospiraceae bacterium]
MRAVKRAVQKQTALTGERVIYERHPLPLKFFTKRKLDKQLDDIMMYSLNDFIVIDWVKIKNAVLEVRMKSVK